MPDRKSQKSKVKGQRSKVRLGFSLVELLVVISIIGMLTTFAAASYSNAQQKSRDGKRKADIKAVQQALELYFQTNGIYPNTNGSGQITCNTGGDTSVKSWGLPFTCNSITFMTPLPKDPIFNSDVTVRYHYYSESPFTTYVLSAKLENARDQDYCSSFSACILKHFCVPANVGTGSTNRNYCQTNP